MTKGAHMTLGQRIKNRRQISGITQKELARKTQITLQHISAIEQDKRTPSLPLIAKLSEHLNTSLDYLVLGKESVTDLLTAINADEILDDEAKKYLINLVNAMRAAKTA
jgi:transcriptional regulator with XRE-family HTH domain